MFIVFLLIGYSEFVASADPWALYIVLQADGFLRESAFKAVKDLEQALGECSKSRSFTKVDALVDLFEGDQLKRFCINEGVTQCTALQIKQGEMAFFIKQGLKKAFVGRSTSRTMVIVSGHGSGIFDGDKIDPFLQEFPLSGVKGRSSLLSYRERQYQAFAQKVHGREQESLFPSKALFMHNGDCMLSIRSMKECITTAVECLEGKKIDIIGFDACRMGMLEFAAELAPYARYLIASQEREYKNGWDYKMLIKSLRSTRGTGSVARAIVYSYELQQKKMEGIPYSLSALDLDAMNELVVLINRVAQLSINGMLCSSRVHESICEAWFRLRQQSLEDQSVDLISYCEQLLVELSFLEDGAEVKELRDALYKLLFLLKQSIKASVASLDRALLKGCSLYFPLVYEAHFYKSSCAFQSAWPSFLGFFNDYGSE